MTALVCPVVRQSHAWCRPRPRIRHDERWIGELMRYSHLTKGTISTTLCRYMATFVRLLHPSHPSKKCASRNLHCYGANARIRANPTASPGCCGFMGDTMRSASMRGGFWPFHVYNTPIQQYHHVNKQPNEFGWARYGQPARTPRVERVAIWSKILIL